MNKSKNESAIRLRSNVLPRAAQRQSIGSHFEIEEHKMSSTNASKKPTLATQKNKQGKTYVYKQMVEQIRSKSEMNFLSLNYKGQAASLSDLKRYNDCNAGWQRLVNKKLAKFFKLEEALNKRSVNTQQNEMVK